MRSSEKKPSQGSLIYINGFIYTVDVERDKQWHRHPQEALVIIDGIIKFVGNNEDALEYKERVHEIIDLKEATVLPGFHDCNAHPIEAGSEIFGNCLLPQNVAPNSKEMEEAIKEGSRKQVGSEWVIGHGFSLHPMLEFIQKMRMTNSKTDPKSLLDKFAVDKRGRKVPAIMIEETGRVIWVNTEGLTRANISKRSPVKVPGGLIMINQFFHPNGILMEGAGVTVLNQALEKAKYVGLERSHYKGLVWGMKQLSKAGITSIIDSPLQISRGYHEIYEKADREGTLTCRVSLGLWVDPNDDDRAQFFRCRSLFTPEANRLLKIDQIKIQVDGTISHTTAAMHEEYVKDFNLTLDGKNKGMLHFQAERLEELIRALGYDGDGFDIDFEVNGDRAATEALLALKREGDNKSRHRMSKLYVIDSNDVKLMSRLNTIAIVQLNEKFINPIEEAIEDLEQFIGPERSRKLVQLKQLVDAGVTVAVGSNWNYRPKNPLLGIKNAVKRDKEAVDVKTAIEMYTINGAFAMRQENLTGSIRVGKAADIVVLSRNIIEIDPNDFDRVEVLQTLLSGKEVYRNRYF